jgi:hypothetical protein
MVIIIHKLPVGSFTFLRCLLGTGLLNLSGTPYIKLFARLSRSEIVHLAPVGMYV